MTTAELTAEIERLRHNGYRTYQDWLQGRNAQHSEAEWSAWMASGFWMLAIEEPPSQLSILQSEERKRYNWHSTGPGGCDDHCIEHPCGPCITGRLSP